MKIKLTALFLTVFSIITIFSSCSKEESFDPIAQFDKEKPIIEAYAKQNYPNMELSSDTTGIWYEILEEGDADSYHFTIIDSVVNGYTSKYLSVPTVTVRYTGKLISNNQVFDSNQTEAGMTGKITSYISAWYYSFVPKSVAQYSIGGLTAKGLKKGSKIRIIAPSYYGYGNSSVGSIPANSPLFFEIEVIDIK